MPTKREKDEATGTETTGHEWDGIKELDTPLPSWWVWVFVATIVWSVGYVVLYPAIPLLNSATQGVLGYSQREVIAEEMASVEAGRAEIYARLGEKTVQMIEQDAELHTFALEGGRAAFADNCAPCHGNAGGGRPGYPVLADDDWLWGGTESAIEESIRYGVRSGHDEERYSEMPPFNEMLSSAERNDLTAYVMSISGTTDALLDDIKNGEVLFGDHCASCHGARGEGMTALGAPALNDAIWLYGRSASKIASQIANPTHGVMPAWQGRLDDATIKMLTIYVYSLGGGEVASEEGEGTR